MAILEVLKYPDPRLRRKGSPVSEVTDELRSLVDDMLETMYDEKGIGLAAIQVGVELQLLVIDISPRGDEDRYDLEDEKSEEKPLPYDMPMVIFNPKLLKKEGRTTYDEGCLSLPGYFETVSRYEKVTVSGLGRDGSPVEWELDGLLSICMQHEMDHLDGKVFIDRLSPIKSSRIKAKIKKLGYPKDDEKGEKTDSVVTTENTPAES